MPVYKIANYELVDTHLIRAVAETRQAAHPVGRHGDARRGRGRARRPREGGATEVALLRCAALYPAPPHIMNLRAMATMRTAFQVPVGLSDHSEGIHVPLGAAGFGMELLEKHFTLDRSMEGPDHPFAIEPDELRALVAGVRDVEAAMGDGRLEGPTEEEAARDVHARAPQRRRGARHRRRERRSRASS